MHPRIAQPPALDPALLRALGDLYVASIELSDLLRGAPMPDTPAEHVDAWRAQAVLALDDATRIARAAFRGVRSPDILILVYRDGSTAAVGQGAVVRAVERLRITVRTGRATGMRSPYDPVEREHTVSQPVERAASRAS